MNGARQVTPVPAAPRAEELRAVLHQASHDYYVRDRPTLSDAEYDRVFRELLGLEVQMIPPRPPVVGALRALGVTIVDRDPG